MDISANNSWENILENRQESKMANQSVTEIIYTWPNGRKKRYRRSKDSQGAKQLIAEVNALIEIHGKDCPYSVRHV